MLTERVFNIICPILEKGITTIKNNIIDYAILGSSSGHYGWKEVRFCDFDVWIFCNNINDISMFTGIRNIIEDIEAILNDENIILLADAINGPYKPEIWEINSKDILFLHLLIDDPQTYNERSIFTKLSWSKYEANYHKNLLKSLLDRMPTEYDLLNSRCGILNTLESLQLGVIKYNQINLFSGSQLIVEFKRESSQYLEFILHSVMMISRNRARLSKQKQPDCLENTSFADWYAETYGDSYVRHIAEYKAKVSNYGYGTIETMPTLEINTIHWLENLRDELETTYEN